ncbi:COG4223 family protein [Sulfitobacter aestuariivivens]|uniref:Mitochondrial inner membrane protein n=1 Tax=Sulfitobacter aestuariivivens TaxID=2766981 RepID=A0A927D7W0_9RHOB|nr:mitofilin family membrane protein [Sulfitobacter aestuariivivens]MBD3665192.1 hypothetical protein [Sulfitobacter aestuariivivens]
MWPLVIGGVIAAVLGFLAAELDTFGTKPQTEDLRRALAAQQEQIAAQDAWIKSREESLVALEKNVLELDMSVVEALSTTAETLTTQLEDIDARLTAVEKQPISGGGSEAAVAAYERELAKLQASVEEQRAEIEGLLDNALSVEEATADAARMATLQGALTDITTAINAGQPFSDAVATLTENGMDDVPDALTAVADSGVATLNSLQARFPDDARISLTAARASGEDGEEAGVGSFLRRQLGARSVAPRDGDDPDAVLSRAEAAVRDGQLAQALEELEALTPAAKDAMQNWLADAQTRHAAVTATKDLSQSLTAN